MLNGILDESELNSESIEMHDSNSFLQKKKKKNKAAYTASDAPRRPKSESVTESITDGRTDGRTHALIESLRRH